jgi:hypothetical protein
MEKILIIKKWDYGDPLPGGDGIASGYGNGEDAHCESRYGTPGETLAGPLPLVPGGRLRKLDEANKRRAAALVTGSPVPRRPTVFSICETACRMANVWNVKQSADLSGSDDEDEDRVSPQPLGQNLSPWQLGRAAVGGAAVAKRGMGGRMGA